MEWISVKDSLPDYSGWYLVYATRAPHPSVCYFVDTENQFYRKASRGKKLVFKTVTHWMSLSEPITP